jgi:hypothetical protein
MRRIGPVDQALTEHAEFIELVKVYVNACVWRYTDVTPLKATRAVALAYNLMPLEVQRALDAHEDDATSAVREFVGWVFGRDSKPLWVSEDLAAVKEPT